MVCGGGLLVITFNSYIPWTEQQQLHSLDGTAFTLVAHVASSGNVRDIFINMHYFCLCCELTYVGGIASVSTHIVDVSGARGAGVRNCALPV